MDAKIIDDFAAVRLLINIYMIKKLKRSFRPVNQENFIKDVCTEFREKNFNYPRRSILFTWKHLLDNYQHYKQNYTAENAETMWKYFDLMDNCFDDSNVTIQKFDDDCISYLIESLSKYKPGVLKQGPTMDMLQAIEDDFKKLGNPNINQKDIFNQWLNLKNVYKKYLSKSTKVNKNYSYYSALKDFFEKDVMDKPSESVSEIELNTAIDSIITIDETSRVKKRKIDNECIVTNTEAICSEYATFTVVMHDILLQSLKRNKKKIKSLNGELDETALNNVIDEFHKHGYNVTKSSICNEWNDLSCRYELIKNSERPEQWPYFDDMNYIYTSEDIDNIYSADDIGIDAASENVGNLLKNTQKVSVNNVEISEKLLNIYECNNKEFLEIKDILLERNLLREETNYLLNIFVEKFSKRKE